MYHVQKFSGYSIKEIVLWDCKELGLSGAQWFFHPKWGELFHALWLVFPVSLAKIMLKYHNPVLNPENVVHF